MTLFAELDGHNSTNAARNLPFRSRPICRHCQRLGEARAETLVDHKYFEDLVAAWSLVATQREIDSLAGLLTEEMSVH
jgi:hypothetical protein